MRTFNGNKQPGQLHADAREYRKLPHLVRAVQQLDAFEVPVSWQKTPLSAASGDWLVSDEEGSWPVANDLFTVTYRWVRKDLYAIKIATVRAVQIDEPFEVATLEGHALASAGDYLAQGPAGEAWPIPRAQFEKTYVPA